jgi:cardiolipin synthase
MRAIAALAATALLLAGCASATVTAGPSRQTAARAPLGSSGPALGLITEPHAGIAAILHQVTAARRSVDLVMYELLDPRFEAALVADAQRGVKVRVLLNGGYYGKGGFPQNAAAVAYLKSHGVPVRSSPSFFALTHQKTLIIDGDVADIMTLNLTSEYYASSRDFAVVDRQSRDVAAIERTFNADWAGNRIASQAGSGDLVWSPGALASQLALISSAHRSIDVYDEEMDDPQITDALAAAARRGVDVKVVMTADSEWDTAFAQLVAAGVHVRTYAADAALYIHAKVLLVDATTGFVGSQNFSAGSLDDNRELGITLTDRPILSSLAQTFAADYAGATPFGMTPPSSSPPVTRGSASCRVSASFSREYGDWDVDVSGAPADTSVSATADGITDSWHTDTSGFAVVYLKAPERDAGATVTVHAGAATCTGTL